MSASSHPAAASGDFDFGNLSVQRLILHAVFAKQADRTIEPPRLADTVFPLDTDTRSVLQRRITDALGSRSHGLATSIEETGANSFFQQAAQLINANVEDFVTGSHGFATALTKAQATNTASPGRLAIVLGRVGESEFRYLAVIKAETQDGFGETELTEAVEVGYIKNLFLTSNQKFFKVGMLVEIVAEAAEEGVYDVANYRGFLFDHLITAVESRKAAAYFYKTFLGMDIFTSNRRLTQEFHEHTQRFINSLSIPTGEKRDLVEAVKAELRSQKAIIQVDDFAREHLPPNLHVPYKEYLTSKGFPKSAIDKDITYVKSKVRSRRKISFDNDVQITSPPDSAEDTVTVTEQNSEWAMVKILGRVKEYS